MKRYSKLTNGHLFPVVPALLLDAIARLVRLDTVRSVSCPFKDPAVWRVLVDEQRRRGALLGVHSQLAFGLTGPDAGLGHVPLTDWGGYVHLPYEGAAPADLFIRPAWRSTFPEYGGADGSLSAVVHGVESLEVGYFCQHLLTNDDMGELACATREDIGDGWVAYASKRPYVEADRRWALWALKDTGR